MKVLLTGATGFLGSEIARELVRQGHALRVLARATSKLDGLEGVAHERVVGDLLDVASVDRALEGMEALIHTAGATSVRMRDKAMLRAVNVDGVANVLEAAARRPGLRVVHTSTVGAVGGSPGPTLLDEEAPWNLGGLGYDYLETKRRGEELALARAREGMDLVVVNPGMIFGPGDVYLTSTKYVLEYLRGKNRFAPRGGLSFCDVRDVARAHVAALTRGRAGERYILAGQNLTHRDALLALRRMTGLYRPIPMPGAVLWLAGALSQALARLRPHPLEDLTLGVVRVAQMFLFFDVSKAQRELGYVVRPFEETLGDTLRDLVARGLFPARTPALAALVEKRLRQAA
jgi:dihydroflavonol-4-reductase